MSEDQSCIFCRIVGGEIPSMQVLESKHAVAFLDVAPLARGHLLLIPRAHYLTITDMPSEAVSLVTGHVPELVAALMRMDGVTGVNVLQNNGRSAGQVVNHVHFHLIPRRDDDGLGFRWNAGKYAEGEAACVRDELSSYLA